MGRLVGVRARDLTAPRDLPAQRGDHRDTAGDAGGGGACQAVYRSPPLSYVLLLGVVPGASAASASLVKQNFVDGLAFVVVLWIGAGVLHRLSWTRVLAASVAFLVRAGGPLLRAVTWARRH